MIFLASPAATITLFTIAYTVTVILCEPEMLPLEAVKATEKAPYSVGVPDIIPVLVFKLQPAGRPVAVKLVNAELLVIV